ncbi:DNA-3-methyladenine glycosylase I [uncultured Friedmanniella sp.]|uniref:DNA-3-methyladenine glycosylase I n=1 Tax=uncultured Friedmanniella sp. TaxID=335381 RepID=UPI0035CB0B57
MSVLPGADGRLRCSWALGAPEYVDYHDLEWGRPVRTVTGLYERMTLEAFQSGLAWITILRKREGFRAAFAGFDPERVAAFGEDDVARLMADAGIVRNRAKIEAAISNARVVAELGPAYAELIWSHATPDRPRPTAEDVRPTTPESVALAKALKGAGIRFFGPTTAYALMQACGLVDDHLVGCFVAPHPDLSEPGCPMGQLGSDKSATARISGP